MPEPRPGFAPIPTDDDIVLYMGVGFVATSVCYPKGMPLEELTAAVNRAAGPTGLSHGWSPSDEPTFASGQPNPFPCEQHPEERLHRLYAC